MESELEVLLGKPGWELYIGGDALVIRCPSVGEATQLIRMSAPTLRGWATKFQLPVLVKPSGSDKAFKIPPFSGVSMPEFRQTVFTAPEVFIWTKDATALLNRMQESDRPMFLIRNSDDRQVWVNDKAASIMRSSGSDCVVRRVSDYWNPSDLHDLYQKLRQDGGMPFQHSYRARLNDQGIWGELTAQYEIVKIDGVSYRLSTTLNCRVVRLATAF